MHARFSSTLTLTVAILVLISCSESSNNPGAKDSIDFESNIEKDAKKFPDSANIQIKWAEMLFDRGDTTQAVDVLLHFQERFSEDISILNALSSVFSIMKDTSSAINYLEQSLAINPNQPDFEMDLVFLHQAQKNNEWKKIAAAMIADKKNKVRSSRGYFARGVFESNNNEITKAIGSFDTSIIQQFTFTDAYIERALLLIEQNNINEAFNGLYSALELDRKNPDIYFLIGECLSNQERFEEARSFYIQTLELEPTYHIAREKLSLLPKKNI